MDRFTSAGALLMLASTALASTPAVTIKGNAFFAGTERFFLRGVDYQPGGSSNIVDPIADATTCTRDIQYFKQLGINTVRVYTVDNSANHDECMNALSAAGIYLALDVNSPTYSLNRDDPAPSYNAAYLQNIFATIDAFAGYSNTLLFFSGNEVINDPTNTNTAPYIKAVTRDMKNYLAARSYRHIPVGYSAADVTQNQYSTGQYMNCGPDAMARSDFYAINDYSWCDPSSFTTAGWDTLIETYSNYSIPLFMSEFGCITNPPRNFGEVAALYNTEMTSVMSGGMVYEYSEEATNPGYGLVNIQSTSSASPKNPEFSNLQSAYAANPAPTGTAGYNANGQYFTECPAPGPDWQISPFSGFSLPALPNGAITYMKSGAGAGPGLTGPGSQNAGGGSQGQVDQTASASYGYTTPTGTPSVNGQSTGSNTTTSSDQSSTPNNAGAGLRPADFAQGPIVSLFAVLCMTLMGAALL